MKKKFSLILILAGYLLLPLTSLYAQDTDDFQVAMTDRIFNYKVVNGTYHIQLTFNDEKTITWKYLSAPEDQTGKSATETIDRKDIREDIILMAWDEDDGTKVIDVLDLGKMMLHANFVTADGQRFVSQADVLEGPGE